MCHSFLKKNKIDGFVKSLGSVVLSDNEESLMPLRTMLWRFFTSFKNDIFSRMTYFPLFTKPSKLRRHKNEIQIRYFEQARHFLTKKIDKYIYKNVVENDTTSLKKVQLKKYEFLSAMLSGAVKNMDKGYISKHVVNKLIEVLVKNSFMNGAEDSDIETEKFKQKYGILPPSFIVLSPTQRCNLNCVGCYASSTSRTAATIPYSVVDKIVKEVHDTFGSRFITVSGGEPFMYRSEGKTLLDIFEKYNDMFFLVYTNGTLITPEIAKRLEMLGNATPAISVEGFEEETDERRGE